MKRTKAPHRLRCGWWFCAAAAFIVLAPAAAQESDPYTEEWSEILDDEAVPGDEEAPEGEGEYDDDPYGEEERELEPEDRPRRLDGTEARRELLFRDGVSERERRYPRGLEPLPSVERSDLSAFDARYRGRNAEVLRATRPGLVVDSSVSAGMFIDDNPLLESSEESAGESTETWGWFVEPRLAVTRRTPRTLLQGVVRLPFDDFESFEGSANDDLGSFDQYAGLQLDVFGRKNAVNFFTNIANATTRTEIVLDTGEDLSDRRTLTFGGGGSFKHALTPDSVIQISGSARRQELDTADRPDFPDTLVLHDSTFYQTALDYRTIITATDTVGLGAIYEKFQPDGLLTRNVDIITAVANWSRDIGPSMVFLLEAGGQIVTGEEFALADSETTVTPFIEASLYWAATSRDRFFFRYAHTADPSATGDIRNNNLLVFEYRRIVTRDISLGVPVQALFQDAPLEDTFDSRTFLRIAPNLVWAFSPQWALQAEYRFRLDKESGLSAATSNAAFLSVTWFGRLFP